MIWLRLPHKDISRAATGQHLPALRGKIVAILRGYSTMEALQPKGCCAGSKNKRSAGEFHMRLKEEQISRLAEKVLADLTASGLVTVKKERGAILAGIKEAVTADM